MKFLHISRGVMLGGLVLSVCACGGTAESLGLGRHVPDEFAVVDRPPLSLPPDFELRPPRPGAPRPQEISASERAEQTVFSASGGGARDFLASETRAELSDSEKALLEKAQAEKVQADIRQIVDREASQKVVGSQKLIESLLWWRESAEQGVAVDAAAEAERLRQSKEKGESVTTGATPVIEKGTSGWIGF